MEDFLLCEPSVFVVADRYLISYYTRENGLATVLVDGTVFYEDNSGVLATNKNFFKIEIPQGLLDGKKKYIQLLTTINMIFSIVHYQCNIESIEELQNLFVLFMV